MLAAISAISHQNLAIFEEERIIDPHLTRLAQVANHIPVDRRLILAASLWIALSKCQVDSAPYLLIEENIFRAVCDVVIVAEREFTEIARPLIEFQHM